MKFPTTSLTKEKKMACMIVMKTQQIKPKKEEEFLSTTGPILDVFSPLSTALMQFLAIPLKCPNGKRRKRSQLF